MFSKNISKPQDAEQAGMGLGAWGLSDCRQSMSCPEIGLQEKKTKIRTMKGNWLLAIGYWLLEIGNWKLDPIEVAFYNRCLLSTRL